MLQRTIGALLDTQLVRGDTVPKELGVPRGSGPQHRRRIEVRRRRIIGGRRGRRELEDAEHHLRNNLTCAVFFGYFPDVTGGVEPPLPQRGFLRTHHVLEHRLDGDLLPRFQVAVIGLVAVGGDHGGETGRVEDVAHRAAGIVVVADLRMQPAHRPDLRHRGRRDDARVARGNRGVGVDVDGIAVTDGLDPVVDHRLVHRVAPGSGLAGSRRSDLLGGGKNLLAHRGTCAHLGTRGSFSPAVAMSSRITSLTPPPKVIT